MEFWACPDRPIKRELNILEADGILTSKLYGRTVLYQFNDRFYLKKELIALLLRAIEAYPPDLKEKLLYNRRRPRAKGKPVVFLEDKNRKVVKTSGSCKKRTVVENTIDKTTIV